MTRKKEIEREENFEEIDIKNISFKELDYFPIGSNNKSRLQFPYGNEYYIVAKGEFSYKGFVINKDNPKGYKFCEFQTESEVLSKIPHYWD
jgi:hypothetical protein